MTSQNKSNKEKKLNSQKTLLNKRINELGIDGILYPSTTLERHPYTQEVILIAMSQDIKQEELTRLCSVSQSQVSQWANGHGFAKVKQLEQLVPKLKNTAPGDQFTQLKVVKHKTIELPDKWEEACFISAFKNEIKSSITQQTKGKGFYHYHCDIREYETELNNEVNLNLLEQSVYGQLRQNHAEILSNESDFHNKKINLLNEKITSLNEYKLSTETEVLDNLKLEEEHIAIIREFYDDRPELNKLPEEDRKSLALREYPEPTICHGAKEQFLAQLEQLGIEFSINNPDELNITQEIEFKIQKLISSHSLKIEEIKSKQEQEVSEKTIFNKYESEYFTSVLINQSLELIDSVIEDKSNELYGEKTINLMLPIKGAIKEICNRYHVYTNQTHIEIVLNLKQAFIDYCDSLSITYEHELVQISGKQIFSSKFDEYDSLGCYRLHSNKLMLKHKIDGQTYIYVESNADDVIKKAQLLNEIHKINDSLEDELKSTLIKQGYLLNNVRTIY